MLLPFYTIACNRMCGACRLDATHAWWDSIVIMAGQQSNITDLSPHRRILLLKMMAFDNCILLMTTIRDMAMKICEMK